MARSWTIGSHSDCDVVVDLPAVSARHCRLTSDGEGFVLEDLGSTNGTFVNGVRVCGEVRVARHDLVTLGHSASLPWPAEWQYAGSAAIRIGRADDNDLVIDLPVVSGYHARVVREGGAIWIEDLDSSNGTSLGSPDRKIRRSILAAGDTIYLGSHPVPAAVVMARLDPSLVPELSFGGDDLVIGREADCDRVIALPMVSGRHARLVRSGDRITIDDLGSSNGTFVNGRRIEGPTEIRPGDAIGLGSYTMLLAAGPAPPVVQTVPEIDTLGSRPAAAPSAPPRRTLNRSWLLVVLLAQAPILGFVISLAAGGPAPTLAWLAIAAVWFGLSLAMFDDLAGVIRPSDGRDSGDVAGRLRRLVGPLLLCVFQCAVAWTVVSAFKDMRAPLAAAVGVLTLAALVGLASGLLLGLSARRSIVAWLALGPIVLVLWWFGGEQRALPRMETWARTVANALPSRWAFEGLLVLEADAREPGPADPAKAADLAESYFPAETERTGPKGAAMALGFLLVGLGASAEFIARASRRPS